MSFELNNLFTSVTIAESGNSGSLQRTIGDSPSVSWKFIIRGASDASTAYSSLVSWLYTNYSDGNGGIASYNMPLQTIQISTTEHSKVYEATCEFAFPSSDSEDSSINGSSYSAPDVEDSDFTYTTTGGTSHITHSLATLGAASTGQVLDFGGGIGWNGENFDGCDVVTPNVSFEISVSRPKTWFNQARRLALSNLSGCVNNAAWAGYGARCVLFRGINAKTASLKYTNSSNNEVNDWYWRISFSFSAMPATTLTLGTTTLTKQGYDYIWRLDQKEENSTTGEIQSAVTQINVEQVYPTADFTTLGLTFPSSGDDDDE